MKKTWSFFALIIGTALATTACTQNPVHTSSTAKPAKEVQVGMPNPASQYCLEQGGKLNIVKTEAGEVGMCLLPDGSEVEEWDFFRKNHPQPK